MRNYEDEVINVKIDLILGIFIVVLFRALFMTFDSYKSGDYNFGIFLLASIMIVVFEVILCCKFFINIVNAIINRKTVKKIKKYGIKVNGEIIGKYETKENSYENSIFKNAAYSKFSSVDRRTEEWDSLYYFVKVKYEFNDKTYIIKSPSLNFNPIYLTSNDVDVYIYNEKCYIDNFVFKHTEQKNEDIKRMNMNILVIILVFMLFIIMGLLIFLHINNIISTKLFEILLLIFISSSVVIALLAYYKSL